MNFLAQNMGTILTGLVLLAIVAAIVLNIVFCKKKNKCAGCPCGCRLQGCKKTGRAC